jgi:hypothetical protein
MQRFMEDYKDFLKLPRSARFSSFYREIFYTFPVPPSEAQQLDPSAFAAGVLESGPDFDPETLGFVPEEGTEQLENPDENVEQPEYSSEDTKEPDCLWVSRCYPMRYSTLADLGMAGKISSELEACVSLACGSCKVSYLKQLRHLFHKSCITFYCPIGYNIRAIFLIKFTSFTLPLFPLYESIFFENVRVKLEFRVY